MIVKVDGLVWLPKDDLNYQNIINIKDQLTIYPRKTTDIGSKADPPPIFLFEEKDDYLGVPRGWYLKNVTTTHEEILNVSYGEKMRDLSTRYRADGHFAEQEDVLRLFFEQMKGRKWGGFLLQASCGFGKALKNGEPVLTINGYVPIENLSIGDRVAGTDGNFYNVTGVYPQGIRDLYRITFTDGTHVDCDGDHLWTFVVRRRDNKVVTIKTEDLFLSNLREKSGRLFWLPKVFPVDFERYDVLPVDPYTLGVILGDGGISSKQNVCITTEDYEILETCKFPPGNRPIPCVGNSSGNATTYRISQDSSSSHIFKEDSLRFILESIGLMGCDSHNKFIPEIYEYSSIYNRLELLRGLFDTDGYPISSGMVEYTTVSKLMYESVCRIVNSLGGTWTSNYRRSRYTLKDGSRSKWFYSYRLKIKLPTDMSPHRLTRKKHVIDSAVWQRKIGRAVDSICKIEQGEATCISVDSPDNLFLTRGCVPTHNTSLAIELARRIGRKTLILVHKEFFLEQWKDQIKYLMPDVRVGIIRQNKCEYEGNDFVIGMLQSLARDGGEKYSNDLYGSFGTIITDETHRIGAQSWAGIVPRFSAAWKIALTATPRRKDGAQDVFFFHISDISYKAETKPQIPKLRILRTQSKLKPIRRGTWHVDISNLNSAQILTQLGADEFRSKDIVDQLVLAVKTGRKIMVVSERISHLKMMSDMLGESLFDMELPFVPVIDFYTGEWYSGEVWEKSTKSHKKGSPKLVKRTKNDLKKAESANVIFCTKQLAEEGLDIPALDVLVLSLPMGDVEQVVGRVRRWCTPELEKCERLCSWRAGECKEKPIPIVMDVVDEIGKLMPKWKRRKRFYRSIGTLDRGNGLER